MLGIGYLAIAAVRAFSIIFDRSTARSNIISLVIEIVLGLILISLIKMVVRIVTDSSCDLPAEVIARYHICVVPLYIHVGSKDYLDGIDITKDEFYKQTANFSGAANDSSSFPAKIPGDL